MEKNRYHYAFVLITFIVISLIPFIWVADGNMILGHDAGTPIAPSAHFLDRLQTWTHRYGLGSNQTFAIPGIFIHGFEFVLDQMGLSVSTAQGVSFFVYMLLMGLSMHYLANTLFPRKKYLPLIAGIFYQINHFTLQAWFVAERTKFTVYIALPIALALIYKINNKSLSPVKAGLITAILFTILNGGGFLPLFGSALLLMPVWIIVLILTSDQKKLMMRKYAIFIATMLISALALNCYWLLPYVIYIRTSFSEVTSSAGGVEGVISWLMSISQWTSYSNLFRLQGIPDWYANPNHPYASIYRHNIFLIFVSYLIPLFAFAPLVIAKKKKVIYLITLTALISILFSAGSHSPFGWFYILLIKFVPGFMAFRTAFYKFAPGIWLAYGLLISYTLDYLIIKVKKTRLQYLLVIIIIGIITGYSFPFITKSFLNYDVNRTTLIKVPQYILDYSKDSNSNRIPFNRILVLPTEPKINSAEHTIWNYWSLASTLSLLDNKSYVDRSVSLTFGEQYLINELYDMLDTNNPEWIEHAKRLGIDGILLREDIVPYEQAGRMITADMYRSIIEKEGFKKIKSYGKWHLYKFSSPLSDVTVHTSYVLVTDLRKDLLFPDFGFQYSKIIGNNTLILNSDFPNATNLKQADIILPHCEKCTIPALKLFIEKTDMIIFPGSQFYALKQKLEKRNEPVVNSSLEKKIEYETRMSLRRVYEMRRTVEHAISKDIRITAWNEYGTTIDKMDQLINKYIDTTVQSANSNTFLLYISDNIYQQILELNTISENVTDYNEGEPFVKLYAKINKLYRQIDKNTFKSENLTTKKYIVPINDQGQYEIWIDPQSLYTTNGVTSSDSAQLNYSIDKKNFSTRINTSDGWVKITTLPLSRGEHKIVLMDESPNLFDTLKVKGLTLSDTKTKTLKLSFSSLTNCNLLDLGRLPRDKYRLEFNVKSEKMKTKLNIFIDSDKKNAILLPSLTNTLDLVESGSSHYSNDFISNGYAPTEIRLCQLFRPTYDNIILTSLELKRLTSPKLVFVKYNENFIKQPLPKYSIKKASNTKYHITLGSHKDIFIQLNQRFDLGWRLNDTHTKSNFYAQAWHIKPSTNGDTLLLEFSSQKVFTLGLIISGVSVLIIGLLFIKNYKRKHD